MENFHLIILGSEGHQVHPEVEAIASAVTRKAYNFEEMMEEFKPEPDVIICYPPDEKDGVSSLEIAQSLRCNYPDKPIFFIASDKKDFDKKKLIKNGFTQAFLLPWEKADLIRMMRDEAVYSILPELRDYKAVKVVDLIPGTILNFPLRIHMPLNNKFLPFSSGDVPVSEEKIKKLKECSLNTLYVHKDDVEKFHSYTASMFKQHLRSTSMSETEKQDKLENCVRELISDMFIQDNKENTFSKSQALLQEVKEVIKILIKDENSDLMSKVDLLVNQEKNFYLHLSNVSTYAGVFSMILGFQNPDQMALAGLLHDIGKINLPVEIADMDIAEMGEHALRAYNKHPDYSLDVTKLKRMSLPDPVMKGILQHHEAMNGSGYPKGLDGSRISQEGRLLAIADEFDYLTTFKPGKKALSPHDALLKLVEDNSKDPGRMILDLEMLKKLKSFFIK